VSHVVLLACNVLYSVATCSGVFRDGALGHCAANLRGTMRSHCAEVQHVVLSWNMPNCYQVLTELTGRTARQHVIAGGRFRWVGALAWRSYGSTLALMGKALSCFDN
jgi:hypothetical protein